MIDLDDFDLPDPPAAPFGDDIGNFAQADIDADTKVELLPEFTEKAGERRADGALHARIAAACHRAADGSHRCAGAGMLVLLELQLRTPCNQIGVAMGQAWQRRAASECSGYRVQRRRGRHPDFAPRPPFK